MRNKTAFHIPQFSYLSVLLKKIIKQEKIGSIELNLTGSRKSAKTYSIEDFILTALCCGSNVRVECFRYYQKDVQEMYQSLVKAVQELQLADYYMIQKNNLTTNWGNCRVEGLFSIDNKKTKIKGRVQAKCDYLIVWCEEFDQFLAYDDYMDIKMAMRNYKNIIYITSSNPKLKTHWSVRAMLEYANPIKKTMIEKGSMLFIDGCYYDKQIPPYEPFKRLVHFSNWRINPFLTEDMKEEFYWMEKNHPFRAEVESYGMPGMIAGGILTNYLHYILPTLTPCSIYVGGVDFGAKSDAMVGLYCGYDMQYQHLNVIKEYFWNNKSSFRDLNTHAKELVKFFWQEHNKPYHFSILMVYCDNSELSFIAMLNNEATRLGISDRLYFKECTKPPIEERPPKLMTLLSEQRLHIFPQCTNLMRELAEWEWEQSDKSLKPKPGNDHCIDSLVYAIGVHWHCWQDKFYHTAKLKGALHENNNQPR